MTFTALDIPDGIHFGLDDEIYHSIPALSSTGIKNLLISGPDFWYRTPWLNPAYEDEETDSLAKIAGRAYHTRILEGKEVFYSKYGPTFDAPPNCLKTIEDIEEALAEHGVTVKLKRKSQWVEKMREVDPSALLFDDLKEKHEAQYEGKELLGHKLIASIEVAAKMVEAHPQISKCFKGGFPEVSVVWKEEANEDGEAVRFKARFDYLKPKAFSDLKTFENYMMKPVDGAIYGAMASRKYHIQFCHYMRASDKAKELPVYGDVIPDDAWLQAFRASEPHACYGIFQQKGIAPLARGKKFLRGSIHSCGEVAIDEAVRRYKHYRQRYGDLPFVDETPIQEFRDDEFPAYTTDL